MAVAHPLFVPLHAGFCNVAELAEAQVPARRLIALYPTTPASYRDFLVDFYTNHPAKLNDPDAVAESYRLLNDFASVIEVNTVHTWPDGYWEAYVEAEQERIIEAQAGAIAAELAHLNHAGSYLPYQFGLLANCAHMLSRWNEAEVEDLFLDPETLRSFFRGLDRLVNFFELDLGFEAHLAAFRRERIQAQGER